MAGQREARTANAGEDKKQSEWMQESRKDVMKDCDELSRKNRIKHYHVITKT